MKFRISRTILDDDSNEYMQEFEKPCQEAEFQKMNNEDLLLFTIEISTLEELIDFIGKYGKIVIERNLCDDIMKEKYHIEIQDEWREWNAL